MKGRLLQSLTVALAAAAVTTGSASPTAQSARLGTIKGLIRLSGRPPANTLIRMGVDPKCAAMNAGRRVLQQTVVTSADGGLANVFVRVQGSFPRVPVPTEPVTIDQRGCVYTPRVVGARIGQTLQVRNSDNLLHSVHSVHSVSARNSFNVGQPVPGMVYTVRLQDEENMLRIACDVHRWMTTYVGIVSHPYFAVSGNGGTFEIANVPVGTHTIQTWHERYGNLSQPVRVRPGATTTVNVTYSGAERP